MAPLPPTCSARAAGPAAVAAHRAELGLGPGAVVVLPATEGAEANPADPAAVTTGAP